MSEIIFKTVTDFTENHSIEELPVTKRGALVKETELLLKCGEGHLLYVYEYLYSGTNKHSGKRWFKKVSGKKVSYKIRELKGKKFLYIWSIDEGKKTVRDVLPSFLSVPDKTYGFVLDMCTNLIGPHPGGLSDMERLVFYNRPLGLGKKDIDTTYRGHINVLPRKLSLRTSSFQDYTRVLCPKRYRKDLVKALANSRSFEVNNIYMNAPENIHTDWIVEALNVCSDINFPRYLRDNIENISKLVPAKHQRKFIVHPNHEYVWDIFQMITQHDLVTSDQLFKGSVGAVHERVVKISNEFIEEQRIKDAENQKKAEALPFKFPEEYNNVLTALEEMWFEVGRTKGIMNSWSTSMNNCISGYTSEASKGRGLYLGYHKDGKLLANIEIKFDTPYTFPGTVKQCLGRYNRNLDSNDFWEIMEILDAFGVIILDDVPSSGIWGYVERVDTPTEELVH